MARKTSPFHIWLRRWLHLLPPGALVADLQYARSHNLTMFQRAGFYSIGIECSPACQERVHGETLVPHIALPLLSHSIDGVWAATWGDRQDEKFVFALQELLRIARAGGFIFFAVRRQEAEARQQAACNWRTSPEEMEKLLRVIGISLCLCDECEDNGQRWLVALARAPWPSGSQNHNRSQFTPLTLRAALLLGKMFLDPIEQNGTGEAEELLCHLLSAGRAELYANPTRTLTLIEDEKFSDSLCKRRRRQPLAYLTGHQGFMSLEFMVTPDVLIPRPETELLVEYVVKHYAKRSCFGLDIGTGSGCIAISVLHYLSHAWFAAVDISAAALDVARQNSVSHGVAERLSLLQGDLFSPVSAAGKFDVIVSNPPYIAAGEYQNLMPEVQCEPKIALLAGDGLEFYRRILSEAALHLRSDGILLLELGYGQDQDVCKLLPPALGLREIIPDHADIPRVLVCERKV
jgi:release factor glutamine methyltransferase